MSDPEVMPESANRGHIYPATSVRDHANLHQGNVYHQQFYQNSEGPDQKARRDVQDALHYEGANDRLDQLAIPNIPFASWDWIWKTSFATWIAGPGSLYWITGKPGSGKSSLMYYLVRSGRTRSDLRHSGQCGSIFEFFFDFRASEKVANDIRGLLYSFLAQLKRDSRQVDELLTRSEQTTPLTSLSDSGLEDLCCRMLITHMPGGCAFIDGLDECHRDHFILADTLIRLQERTGLRMVLASRSEFVFKTKFHDLPFLEMHEHNGESISRYIDDCLDRGRQALIDVDTIFSAGLRNQILSRAQGVIIWVRLAVDELLRSAQEYRSEESLSKILEALPPELEEMYSRILQRGTPNMQRDMALLLSLITLKNGEISADILRDWWFYFHSSLNRTNTTIFLSRLRVLLGVLVDILPGNDQLSADRNRSRRLFGEEPESVRVIHETVRNYTCKVILTSEFLKCQLGIGTLSDPYFHLCVQVVKAAVPDGTSTVSSSASKTQVVMPRMARQLGSAENVGEALLCHVLNWLKYDFHVLDVEMSKYHPIMCQTFSAVYKIMMIYDESNCWELYMGDRLKGSRSPLHSNVATLRSEQGKQFQLLLVAGFLHYPTFILHEIRYIAMPLPEDCQKLLYNAVFQYVCISIPTFSTFDPNQWMSYSKLIAFVHRKAQYIDRQLMCLYVACTNHNLSLGPVLSMKYLSAVLLQEQPTHCVKQVMDSAYVSCQPLCMWIQWANPSLFSKAVLRTMNMQMAHLQTPCSWHYSAIYPDNERVHPVDGKFAVLLKSRLGAMTFRTFEHNVPISVKQAQLRRKTHKWQELLQFMGRKESPEPTTAKPSLHPTQQLQQNYVHELMEYHKKNGAWPSPIPSPPGPDHPGAARSFHSWEFDSSGMVLFTEKEKEELRTAARELDLVLPEDLR